MYDYIPAETALLGNPLGYHRFSQVEFYFALICLLCFCAFFAWLSFSQFPQSLPLLLFVLLILGWVIYLGAYIWNEPHCLRIFEHGIVVERRAGSVVLPWMEVKKAEITIDSYRGKPYVDLMLQSGVAKPIRIRAALGERPKANSSSYLPHMTIEQVITVVEDATHIYRLKIAQACYEAGGKVDFRKLQVSSQGLHVKRATLPWSQVRGLYLNDAKTMLVILQEGSQQVWDGLWLNEMFNLDILAPLIAVYHPHLTTPENEETSRK